MKHKTVVYSPSNKTDLFEGTQFSIFSSVSVIESCTMTRLLQYWNKNYRWFPLSFKNKHFNILHLLQFGSKNLCIVVDNMAERMSWQVHSLALYRKTIVDRWIVLRYFCKMRGDLSSVFACFSGIWHDVLIWSIWAHYFLFKL